MQKTGLAGLPGGSAVVVAALALAVAGLGALMAALPVLPVLDLPNHSARLTVLADPARFAGYYEVVWSLQPNIAMDWIYATLLPGTDVYTFARGWFWLSFALFVSGGMALRWVLYGRLSVMMPLLAVAFFSIAVRMGFLNYLMALSVLLWALAAQRAMRGHPIWQRLAAGTGFSLALYFCHPFGLAMFGLIAGFFALCDARMAEGRIGAAARGLAIVLGQTVLALGLAVAHFAGNQSDLGISYRPLSQHLTMFSRIFDGYDPVHQMAMLVGVTGFYMLWTMRRKTPGAPPLLHPLLIAPVIALLAISLAMPWQIGESGELTWRLYPMAATLLLIGLRDDFLAPKAAAGALAVALTLTAWKGAGIAIALNDAARAHVAAIETVRALPPGARVVSFVPFRPQSLPKAPELLSHGVAYAVVERDAFVPSLFANPSQQPMRYPLGLEPLRRDNACLEDWHFIGTDWDAVRAVYDHVLVLSNEGVADHWAATLSAEGFAPLAATGHGALYRRDGQSPGPLPTTPGPATGLAQCWAHLLDIDSFAAAFDDPFARLQALDEALLSDIAR